MKADTLRICPSTSVSRVTIQLVGINRRVNSSLYRRHDAANFSPETMRTRHGGRGVQTGVHQGCARKCPQVVHVSPGPSAH